MTDRQQPLCTGDMQGNSCDKGNKISDHNDDNGADGSRHGLCGCDSGGDNTDEGDNDRDDNAGCM